MIRPCPALIASLVALIAALTSAPSRARANAQATTADATGPALRRFALVASSNDGGSGRPRLRFADTDAAGVVRVLGHLGGVSDRDLFTVPNATRGRLMDAFARARASLLAARRPGQRLELFVYYSGHSDEDGLLVGGERVIYPELRQLIESAGADVRIAVLDSCASGAMLRLKGGIRRPSFLSDLSTQARGHAFLTASSASEAAQESDRIGAAFFTHFLVSGLRGAADVNRDGRVTLNEAYKFAHDETLQRTEKTRGGAQHAAYDIQLAGTGDLVMTDLRATNARLVIPDNVAGRLFIRDSVGRLIVELRKEPNYPVELGLEPGPYRVHLDADGRPFEAQVTVAAEGRTELGLDRFVGATAMATLSRGGGPEPHPELASAAAKPRVYRHVPVDLVLAPGMRVSHAPSELVRHDFVLGLVGHSDVLSGLQLSFAGNIVEDEMRGVQLAAGFNLARGPARGVQLSAFGNIANAEFRGLQLGAFANVARVDVRGAQVGLVNLASNTISGAQIGLVGVADEVRGAQVGLVNLTSKTRGAAIGLVNVNRQVDGIQIGLVNYAERNDGVSIALLPIVRNGYNRFVAWASDLVLGNVGVKLGTRHVYTLLGVGAGPDHRSTAGGSVAAYSLGLGGHFELAGGRFFIDLDALSTQTGSGDRTFEPREAHVANTARAMFGWQIARHLAITGGPTYNVQVSWEGTDNPIGQGWGERVIRDGATTIRMSPGFVLGLQI